ncbi:arylsulfatase [Ginsengibacter hankyongi]|uniref:Arylsulfatase n=1 Tax=Ginsengibacter hankyongi TaxID=2607284 RepID=A0A5J5ILL4_9BACT|nr:arylsulfatase [Ginsengibacter hankyongi]KAA9041910.1 arylsulfatase [Ginsengibacter hankyongi]
MIQFKIYLLIPLALLLSAKVLAQHRPKPSVIIIYSDDVGYGDISCYGAGKIQTPNIDKIAEEGIRFTNAHASSSTCTPSRYALLTGKYPWRKKGTGIAAGDTGSIIDETQFTLGDLFQNAGYQTAVIGKWHLGLGGPTGPNWNDSIKPSPNDLGFNYSFIIPATPDRVPCVYVENHHVVNLDLKDPIEVSYQHPIGTDPIGTLHPELLKVKADLQHSGTIINGISRIGYMKGGHQAYWKDDQMSDEITNKALQFISDNKQKSFFLYFAIQDVHVPRLPNGRFRGKSGMGARGDALLELDENTGKILHLLDSLHLSKNTLVIFSSDNGPVLNDGYQDSAKILLNGHDPSGPYKGWKYSKFDAGTRVPMMIRWPGIIKKGEVSQALIGQIDFLASMAHLLHFKLPDNAAPDSKELFKVLSGKSKKGRKSIIEQGLPGLAILKGDWKFIPPSRGAAVLKDKDNLETGNSNVGQLYNLKDDIGETKNLASKYPNKAKELSDLLFQIQEEVK